MQNFYLKGHLMRDSLEDFFEWLISKFEQTNKKYKFLK